MVFVLMLSGLSRIPAYSAEGVNSANHMLLICVLWDRVPWAYKGKETSQTYLKNLVLIMVLDFVHSRDLV
jgi:hypothetical protein